MPVTWDSVMRARELYWVMMTDDLNKNMVYVGLMLACNFMWRVSEYVMDADRLYTVGGDQAWCAGGRAVETHICFEELTYLSSRDMSQ